MPFENGTVVKLFVEGNKEPVEVYRSVDYDEIEFNEGREIEFPNQDKRIIRTNLAYIIDSPAEE